MSQHQIPRGDQYAGRTVATLQAMLLSQRASQLLHTIVIVKSFNCRDASARAGMSKRNARPGYLPINVYGAGTADAMLTPQMGARQMEVIANVIP